MQLWQTLKDLLLSSMVPQVQALPDLQTVEAAPPLLHSITNISSCRLVAALDCPDAHQLVQRGYLQGGVCTSSGLPPTTLDIHSLSVIRVSNRSKPELSTTLQTCPAQTLSSQLSATLKTTIKAAMELEVGLDPSSRSFRPFSGGKVSDAIMFVTCNGTKQ